MRDGFSQAVLLPSSQKYDSILCSCIADVNWDGLNELALGTFGKVGCDLFIKVSHLLCTNILQRVLLYQFYKSQGNDSLPFDCIV